MRDRRLDPRLRRDALRPAHGSEKIGKEIDKFNAIAKEETEKAKAPWVDITPGSREVPKDKEPPSGQVSHRGRGPGLVRVSMS